ncbi:ribosome biogenesis GTP-binding protein YihA/YsxC [Mycoplasmopsis columbinasalis]|uniref:Probable GTP-binding protein EngB n=1 Tax=Mycoplasmopsis columbinasalis TaxID=114880 RepID=A0A449BAL7_9BACT|nr:ribosome biogenesis GTP-binding protein YihA/YsxC [Mycoplasmopsis columbinasalis]VEU78244.1 ribosome biogenesis GTP-binding protein YsxC [Mycoplasmopsis columbinasalis]
MWKFEKSTNSAENFLRRPGVQVCFWGRSNVGKSSLLNALVGQNLAFVSKTPGRTQLINYFSDHNGKLLVDLPGYGFAQMSKSAKIQMMQMIETYLADLSIPKHIILLIDSRLGFTELDAQVITFLNHLNLPISLVYTKIDKLNQSAKHKLVTSTPAMLEQNFLLPTTPQFFVSSHKPHTLNKLVLHIENLLYESEK